MASKEAGNIAEMVAESVSFLVALACDCQTRGGVSLEDAHTLYVAKKDPVPKVPISTLQRIVLAGQGNGNLSLQEAWSAYNAFAIIEKDSASQ